MKKAFLSILAIVAAGSVAIAQDNFTPEWFMDVKAGAAWSAGSSNNFGTLFSPSADLSLGYGFKPGFSLRGNISGWQGKGALVPFEDDDMGYKYNYVQLAADAVWNICNTFNYDADRVVNPYVFAGPGLNFRFNNTEVQQYADIFPVNNELWQGGVLSVIGRVGAGVMFRCNDVLGIELELADNLWDDASNSLSGHLVDHHITGLVGINYSFGEHKSVAAPVRTRMTVLSDAADAARRAAEKAVAEAEAAKRASESASAAADVANEAAAKAAAAKAAAEAERLAAEKAAAEQAAARATTQTLYFKSECKDVNKTHAPAIQAIVDILNTYPEAVVTVTGYSDNSTGSADYNLKLSQKRAENVAKAIVDAGIAWERITVKWVGDTEALSEVSKENRAVVCVTK